jgi:hypothetical protein
MYAGSMVGAGSCVFAVWGYVIANAVASRVELNPKLLSAIIGDPVEAIEAAIRKLEEPDDESRSKDNDGRRLVREGQFQYFVPTWEKYRLIRQEEERREYNRQAKRKERSGGSATKPGYVYYARATGRVKIGYSRNPWSRVSEMKTFNPDLALLATEPGDMSLEALRHEQFSSLNIEGEWFKDENPLSQFITTITTSLTTTSTATTSAMSAKAEAEADTEAKERMSTFACPTPAITPAAGPPAAALDQAVFEFPVTANGGKPWPLTRDHLSELSQTFDTLNVLAECKKALGWINADRSRRKTPRGMPRFLHGWMSRANDRGGGRSTAPAVGRNRDEEMLDRAFGGKS